MTGWQNNEGLEDWDSISLELIVCILSSTNYKFLYLPFRLIPHLS